jgi:hypothetical protein
MHRRNVLLKWLCLRAINMLSNISNYNQIHLKPLGYFSVICQSFIYEIQRPFTYTTAQFYCQGCPELNTFSFIRHDVSQFEGDDAAFLAVLIVTIARWSKCSVFLTQVQI